MSETEKVGTTEPVVDIDYPEGDDWVAPPSGSFVAWETPGQTVQGVVLEYDAHNGSTTFNGDPCGYVVIGTGDEEKRVSLDKDALRDSVNRCRPQVGDEIWIAFLGLKDTKDGKREYKAFDARVRYVDRDEAPIA